jgi:hypothetical protein
LADPVNTLSWLSGHGFEASENAVPGSNGPADDQDGIVAADGAQDIRPSLTVQGRRDRLGATRHRTQNQHLANTIDPKEKLRQQRVESSSAFLYATIGNSVAGALRGWYSGEAQFPEIAGEGRLGHVPPALEQHLPQIFLTAYDSRIYDLEDGVVSFALVGHGVSLAPLKAMRERAIRIIDAQGV